MADERFFFENFYHLIQESTPQSVTLPLSRLEAEALQQIYPNRQPLNAVAHLVSLMERVSSKMQELGWDTTFVKLSDRSPKDAVGIPKLKEIAQSLLPKETQVTPILAINAFLRAQVTGLCVRSGEQAVVLLANSRRINQDLTLALRNEEEWKVNIILRKFEHFDPLWEFRGFVVNNSLCACCQYQSVSYLPELLQNKEEIQTKIVAFFEQSVKTQLSALGNYVVDFALLPDLSKIWIVEINDPPPVTGTGMFDPTEEADMKAIASEPLTFRIMDQEPPDWWLYQEISKPMGAAIREMINEAKPIDK